MRYGNYILAFLYLIYILILAYLYLTESIDISKDIVYLGGIISTGILFIILAIPSEKD